MPQGPLMVFPSMKVMVMGLWQRSQDLGGEPVQYLGLVVLFIGICYKLHNSYTTLRFSAVTLQELFMDHHLIPPEIPNLEQLAPWLAKLNENPGSCVVITIEHLRNQNFPHVGRAWLSSEERKRVRRALQGVNTQRRRERQLELNEIPA